jgi:hypothetical protein
LSDRFRQIPSAVFLSSWVEARQASKASDVVAEQACVPALAVPPPMQSASKEIPILSERCLIALLLSRR